jgi:hypothetical protein
MWGPAASSPESHRFGRYAMTTTTSTAAVVYAPGLVDPEHVALSGFLGGYRGLTRDAYPLASASSWRSVTDAISACSRYAAATSRPSDGSSRRTVG